MATSAISSATSTQTQTTSDRGVSALASEDFFKLMITELKQQDPLEPAKTADMVNQVAQIRSIELSKNLTDALTRMNAQQHTAGASELLGKYVTATVSNGDGSKTETGGVVTGVRFASDGSAVLELDTGGTVAATDVTRIMTQDAAEAAGLTKATTTTGSTTETTSTTTDKTSNQSKRLGLFPWLSLDSEIHL